MISSKNFPVLMHLLSIDLNCQHIEKSATRLRTAAQHWINISNGINDGQTYPPIEIISDCGVCLSAAAGISKSLYIGKRNNKSLAEQRTERLLNFLGNPCFPEIQALSVRNSWEHMDERLDELLSQKQYSSYSEIVVLPEKMKNGEFPLRVFDPNNMMMGYGQNERMSISKIQKEALNLRAIISSAIKRLNHEVVVIYKNHEVNYENKL